MDDTRQAAGPRLNAELAFVVHILEAEPVLGRVEHVNSGRCMRFGSVSELMEFMQRTVRACGPDDDGPCPAPTVPPFQREGNVKAP
jgi:hypothetical protein